MIHVVLTRAEPDAKRQLDLLSRKGFAATALPLLAIESVAVSSAVKAELENIDIIIFTSANAVSHGLSHLMSACHRTSTKVLAVGRKTRDLLNGQGIAASSPDREDSEGLLELLYAAKNVAPHSLKRVALIKLSLIHI